MANLIYIEKKNWDIIYPFFKNYFNEKYDEENRCITVNSNKFLMHIDKVLCGSLDGITAEIMDIYDLIDDQYSSKIGNVTIHIYEDKKIAYKVFKIENYDKLYCYPSEEDIFYSKEKFYFKEGEIYILDGAIEFPNRGFHFCKNLEDIFNSYNILSNKKIYKVEILGDIIDGDHEGSCTNKLKVLKKLEEFEFNEIIRNKSSESIYRSDIVSSSYAIRNSNFVKKSGAISDSDYINYCSCIKNSEDLEYSSCVLDSKKILASNCIDNSFFIRGSDSIKSSNFIFYSKTVQNSMGVLHSRVINNSIGVFSSFAIDQSIGVIKSSLISKGLFVYNLKCKDYIIFNKKVDKDRFNKIYNEARKKLVNSVVFSHPDMNIKYLNWENCSQFFDFIKSLDEYDENIFNKIIK